MADKLLNTTIDPATQTAVVERWVDQLDGTWARKVATTGGGGGGTGATPTGATNADHGQLAPTTTAATAVIARPTRTSVRFLNAGSVNVYVGKATVTTANGVAVQPGASLAITYVGLVQMITPSGTGALQYWDEYN